MEELSGHPEMDELSRHGFTLHVWLDSATTIGGDSKIDAFCMGYSSILDEQEAYNLPSTFMKAATGGVRPGCM